MDKKISGMFQTIQLLLEELTALLDEQGRTDIGDQLEESANQIICAHNDWLN